MAEEPPVKPYPHTQSVEFIMDAPGRLRFAANGDFTSEELCFALDILKDRILKQVQQGKNEIVIRPEVLEALRGRAR